MYFPYVRGRQFDLKALQMMIEKLKDSNIIPIIEPVAVNSRTLKSYAYLKQGNIPFVFILNPAQTDGAAEDFKKLSGAIVKSNRIIPALLIHQETTLFQVNSFLRKYRDRPRCLIHQCEFAQASALAEAISDSGGIENQVFFLNRLSKDYIDSRVEGNRIILEDGFNRQGAVQNADFADEEFFSSLPSTYKRDGYYGFGDFGIVGDKYSVGGGAAQAVAIHLTFCAKSQGSNQTAIRLRHFVSDRKTGQRDVAGKFSEALRKLVAYADANRSLLRTDALREFIKLHEEPHFPGLGDLKRISQQHHLELMIHELRSE